MRGRFVVVAVAVSGTTAGWAVGATDATFDGQTRFPAAVSLLSVGPPSALSVEPRGNDVALSWTAGENGTGYEVRAGSTCSSLAAVGEPLTTTHTDTPSEAAGTARCYGVVTRNLSWTSATGNPAAVVQVGFVATTVSMANGGCGTNGVLDCGDTLVLQFNQPVATTAVTAVCTDAGAGTIVLGCESAIGTLQGGTIDEGARYEAASAWSNGARTLTLTVGSRVEGATAPSVSGSWTLTPAGLTSATGDVPVCTTAGQCRPVTSTSP